MQMVILRVLSFFLAFLLLPGLARGDVNEVTVMLPGDVPLVMVRIPAGTFLMGSPEGERGNIFENETQHQVTLTQDYYMGKSEVTQQQWQAVMGTPMRTVCGDIAVGDDFPVYCVTWDRIAGPGGFMEKLNEQLGVEGFRLPTEAEWERAARAETTTRFSHGDVLQCDDDCGACAEHDPFMWWCGNNSPIGPKPVGQKQPNPFGLHDMHGNLWEIVNDLYDDFYGSGPGEPVTDPTGPTSGFDIVLLGGGAVSEAMFSRSATRLSSSPDDRAQNNEVGFRITTFSLDGLEAQINVGHAGAWFNPETSGQGQFIDVEPETQFMFVSWFTFTDAASDHPFEQRWLTAQGNYSGNTAELDLWETLGGRFDDPQEVTRARIGEVTLSFNDCEQGLMSYSIDEEELQGEFPLNRVIPGSGNVCEELGGNTIQAVDINAGMDGAWFDSGTPGQGFFIDAHPDPEGSNFIFVSWFTYGEQTASGQRWLTAQGGFEGSTAEIDVWETTGGSFDDPEPVSRTKVGTMSLDFTDCSNAQLTYSLPADSAEGDIAITRVIPGSQALCEELAGAE